MCKTEDSKYAKACEVTNNLMDKLFGVFGLPNAENYHITEEDLKKGLEDFGIKHVNVDEDGTTTFVDVDMRPDASTAKLADPIERFVKVLSEPCECEGCKCGECTETAATTDEPNADEYDMCAENFDEEKGECYPCHNCPCFTCGHNKEMEVLYEDVDAEDFDDIDVVLNEADETDETAYHDFDLDAIRDRLCDELNELKAEEKEDEPDNSYTYDQVIYDIYSILEDPECPDYTFITAKESGTGRDMLKITYYIGYKNETEKARFINYVHAVCDELKEDFGFGNVYPSNVDEKEYLTFYIYCEF